MLRQRGRILQTSGRWLESPEKVQHQGGKGEDSVPDGGVKTELQVVRIEESLSRARISLLTVKAVSCKNGRYAFFLALPL